MADLSLADGNPETIVLPHAGWHTTSGVQGDRHSYGQAGSTSYLREQEQTAQRPSRRRTRSGCTACRRRKVKCDGVKPTCTACNRLELNCIWPVIEEKTCIQSSRQRGAKACEECQTAKARCDLSRPSCGRCSQRRRVCVYGPLADRGQSTEGTYRNTHWNSGTSSASPPVAAPQTELKRATSSKSNTAQTGLPHDAKALVKIYFNSVYNIAWYSFLHRGSFMRRFNEGTFHDTLLLSVCCAAGAYEEPNSERVKGWIKEVKSQIHAILDAPSLDLLAVILNILICDAFANQLNSVWLLSGLATRLACGLRLNVEPDRSIDPVRAEEGRRMMWACFCWDGLTSAGNKEYAQASLSGLYIALPCHERNFALGLPGATRALCLPFQPSQTEHHKSVNEGLLARLVTIQAIRRRIAVYVFNLSGQVVPPWHPQSTFSSCRLDLLTWEAELGSGDHLTSENMWARESTGQLGLLVSLHLWRHQCAADLHRIAIHAFAEAASPQMLSSAPEGWLREAQHQCFQAAVRVSEVAEAVVSTVPDFVLADPHTAVCLYEALRVQMWAFHNLIATEEFDASQIKAIGRIKATINLLSCSQCLVADSRRLLGMLRSVFQQSSFKVPLTQALFENYFSSGTASPVEVLPKQFALTTQGKHNLLARVQYQLIGLQDANQTSPTSSHHSDTSTQTYAVVQARMPAQTTRSENVLRPQAELEGDMLATIPMVGNAQTSLEQPEHSRDDVEQYFTWSDLLKQDNQPQNLRPIVPTEDSGSLAPGNTFPQAFTASSNWGDLSMDYLIDWSQAFNDPI